MPLKVAIVDDNNSYREGLRYLIDLSSDFECSGTFFSGKDLLNNLPTQGPDVILMDIEMPDMDGITCTTRLKTIPAYQHTSVVVLSILEDNEKIMEAIFAGASGYLLKGETPENILSAIRQVHAGGSPMSPEIARKVLNLVRLSYHKPIEKIKFNTRETEVLSGLADGLSYKMIGDKYAMATDTVRGYIKKIYEKMQVHSRSEAVVKAIKNKFI